MNNRKIFYFLFSLVTTFFLAACSEDNDKEKNISPNLGLSTSHIDFISTGESKKISVTTNQTEFKASVTGGDEEWITLQIEDKEIKISVMENPDQESRTSTLTVKAGGLTKRARIFQEAAPAPPVNPKTFAIPSFGENTFCYKLMSGEEQLGIICKEYLKGPEIDAQAIVVYPMSGITPDLSQGFIAQILATDEDGVSTGIPVAESIHGGAVGFDKGSNSISLFIPGSKSNIEYISIDAEGHIFATEALTDDRLTLVPDYCTDICENNYGIVKIGTQFWMQQNLRTTKLADGTDISTAITGDQWLKVMAYRKSCDDNPLFGLLYNARAAGHADGIFSEQLSPAGYKIPANAEWESLVSYIGANPGGKLKTAGNDHWDPFDKDPAGTNITGFSAVGTSYGNGDGSLAEDGIKAHCFYITATAYDQGAGRFNINRSATSFLLQPEGGAALGYSVRCIRY